jgi:hypothetical protein
MFERGQIVECIEKPGWLDGFSRGKTYVVNDVSHSYGHEYIKILGDDDQAHSLAAKMFRVVRATPCPSCHGIPPLNRNDA